MSKARTGKAIEPRGERFAQPGKIQRPSDVVVSPVTGRLYSVEQWWFMERCSEVWARMIVEKRRAGEPNWNSLLVGLGAVE